MSSSRSPKDLKQIVADSSKDVDVMHESLKKLRSLSEDDKTENAMLRSRIDEQSQLIMILKQRADEATSRMGTLDRINKELTDFRDSAKDQIEHEIRKFNILDKRFHELASNHEEMIRFKDEYKRQNQELRLENARLKEENKNLFSGAIQEKDAIIDDLDRKLESMKEHYSSLESKHRQMLQELRNREEGLRNELTSSKEQYKTDFKNLQSKLQDVEERLKAANYKLQNQVETQQNASAEALTKIQQLTKEKDELLDLAMQRGKLVQKEQLENKKLVIKIDEMEKAVREMEDKFE
ncbi:hypothetical protein ACJMK2_023709 [Sinanodonta woodiana]|uniref:Coiled-coil domain-containing protein 89 n=1 Tax=Sinanodonta woodiana TaxID=1069815 RepID=A0ABD3T558_SINWO